jgi:ABC-type lipoprotein export system ATPase subunit
VRAAADYIRKTHIAQPQQNPAAVIDTPVIVSLEHVTKTYKVGKQQIKALDDVSLTIHEGEIVAITGKSGSGKSTLLQMIGCLDKPTHGEILIGSKDTKRLSDNKLSELRQKTIGFVFQSFYLQPFLKLDQNVSVPAMFARTPVHEINDSVTSLLEQVGINEHRKHFPRELSGGQTQRAAIARALINQPKIILADEPTGNLDSTNSAAIIDLFKKIRSDMGTTVIIVTHDEQIARQADRTITLVDGAIV